MLVSKSSIEKFKPLAHILIAIGRSTTTCFAVAAVFVTIGINELIKKVPPAMLKVLLKDRENFRRGATAAK